MTTFESRLDRIEALLERHIIQAERDRQQAERDGEAPAAGIAKLSKMLLLKPMFPLKD